VWVGVTDQCRWVAGPSGHSLAHWLRGVGTVGAVSWAVGLRRSECGRAVWVRVGRTAAAAATTAVGRWMLGNCIYDGTQYDCVYF